MLTIGSDVLVRTLKRRGVVVEMLKAGVYRVQVGAMTITAGEKDLEAPAPSKKKKGRQTPASAECRARSASGGSRRPSRRRSTCTG